MEQQRIKTLLITDSGTIDRMLSHALGKTRHDIHIIHSEDEGYYQKIVDLKPDLIFLKSELNNVKGVSICRIIKNQAELAHSRVIFLSSNPDVREQAIQSRADRFLPMPFTPRDVKQTVDILTEERPAILYVDDSDMLHHLIVPPLRDEGYTVYEAWDGQEALELIDKLNGKVDLILSDVEMPVMDGHQFCKSVRSTLTEDIPFVLLTSLGTEDAIHRGFDAGADDYILKPVVLPEVLSRVKRLLNTKHKYGVVRTERILVVDDSGLIRDMIAKALEAQGFEVDEAEHGLAGLSKLREKEYHILVTDFEMPHLDGVELCQRIRKGETGQPRLPILFATTHTSKTDIVKMRSLGIQSVIGKPFTPERIVAEVERVLAENLLEQKRQMVRHFFPERAFSTDANLDLQDPAFADDQFRVVLSTRISDIAVLSKQMNSKELVKLLNLYLDRMAEILDQSGTAIEKLSEDQIFVSFTGKEEGAVQAIRAALKMIDALPALNKTTGHTIRIRTGIHAGHVILGNLGVRSLGRQITLLGENIQAVRSIRNQSKDNKILISHAVLELVGSKVSVEQAGTFTVTGKKESVPVAVFKSMQESA